MKCLSVSQPFAHLIVTGRKKIELRNWNTKFRGEFLVHAPLVARMDECRRLNVGGELVTGAIVGKAEIWDVKVYDTKASCRNDYELHLASKEFHGRRYGFMLKNAKMFRTPVQCKGWLGFFDVEVPGKREADIVADIVDEEHRYRLVGHH